MALSAMMLAGCLWAGQIPSAEGRLAEIQPVEPATTQAAVSRADGYYGIWYANQKLDNEYVWKYSGGLGTYCAKHTPIAIYDAEADKTFFVYGGTNKDALKPGAKRTLLAMVGYYDHKTGLVPRPVILIDKQTTDAHDNPVISIDDDGYIWVFVAAHGTARPSYIYRSLKPRDIGGFELVSETNFSYPQPWYIEGKGFLFLHTLYVNGRRCLYDKTSPDGREWTEPRQIAAIEKGHYQISRTFANERTGAVKTAMAFNVHPTEGGLNARTNLYYLESGDFGKTWRTVNRRPVKLPLTDRDNPALIRAYSKEGRLVYLKDLTFDSRGNPIILYVTSQGFKSGPESGPRYWTIARWTGREWEINAQIRSDNNYDTGCLHVEKIDLWHLIGPTDVGPQPFNTGGEMVMWTTTDVGRSWTRKTLTSESPYNHTYARRPVNADDDFYAIWADGHGRELSESRLYFCNINGDVYRLPTEMVGEFAKPILVTKQPEPSATEPAGP